MSTMRLKIGKMSSRKLTSLGGQRAGVERVPPEPGRVVGGDQTGHETRPVVGRRDDDPAGIGLERPTVGQRHGGQHRAVAHVVDPSVVVGERRQAEPVRASSPAPTPAGTRVVPSHPSINSPSGTGTSWNRPASSGTGVAPTPLIVRRPEATTSWSRSAPVTSALRRLTGSGDGDVHRRVEVVPGRLLVGDADRPGDRAVGGGELLDHLALGRRSRTTRKRAAWRAIGPAGVLEAVRCDGQSDAGVSGPKKKLSALLPTRPMPTAGWTATRTIRASVGSARRAAAPAIRPARDRLDRRRCRR